MTDEKIKDRPHPLGRPAPSVPPKIPSEPFYARIEIKEDFGRVIRSRNSPFSSPLFIPHGLVCSVTSTCDQPNVDPLMAREVIAFIRQRLDEWERNLDKGLDEIWGNQEL